MGPTDMEKTPTQLKPGFVESSVFRQRFLEIIDGRHQSAFAEQQRAQAGGGIGGVRVSGQTFFKGQPGLIRLA